jgi:hypothetical protein
LRAQEVGKKPQVQYDPNVMPKGAVRQFAKDNPDFDLEPRDLSEPPKPAPDESGVSGLDEGGPDESGPE